MFNFAIVINKKATGRCVVNSPSKEKAQEVYEHFNGKTEGFELEEIPNSVAPSMFSNCIVPANAVVRK